MAETFFDRIAKTKTAHTPDVLSCLANLSNDEVFTPPDVVNKMLDLLPQELFSDPTATFLDPACKTGVFLREIAKRLLIGLQDKIPDLQERIDHIFHKQLYGIAITELTSLLSRRSLYCSKYPNGEYSISHFDTAEGNIRYRKINHTFINGKCKYCGAAQTQWERGAEKESHAYEFIHTDAPEKIFNMKFDVIISNPPYQLSDGGAQASAMPIYNKFVEQAKKMFPRYLLMIIPARWYSGGKGLDDFRNNMLTDNRLREIHDFISASDCFTGVEIKGGVCYFLWDRDNPGLCNVYSHSGNQIVSQMERPLLEKNCNTFIRYNGAISILHKVLLKGEDSFSNNVFSAKTFGFRTYFTDFDIKETTNLIDKHNLVLLYANHCKGYMYRSSFISGIEYLDSWKIFIPEAVGSGNSESDKLKPILGAPNTACTETYIMNGTYKDKYQAENAITYIRTKFFHFLVGLKKNTQHTTKAVYQFVPMQDFSKPWTDEELYKKYDLSQEEINFIESMIKPME